MKEIKLKPLWCVDVDYRQMNCFKLLKDAKEYANKFPKSFVVIQKRKVLTDKY